MVFDATTVWDLIFIISLNDWAPEAMAEFSDLELLYTISIS